jgi:hypothetical protein
MSALDPGQREHELVDALVTLLIAVSRYGNDDANVRPIAERLATIAYITALIADDVARRIGNINGKEAERAFRRRFSRPAFPPRWAGRRLPMHAAAPGQKGGPTKP